MKTKKFKSKNLALILALMLTVVFTCGLFSACNKNEDKKIEVSFNLNYPDAPNAPNSKEVTVDGKYGLLSSPKRSGYNFVGWYLNSQGTGEVITKDTVVTLKDDHTLFAKWEETLIVTVTFYIQGEVEKTGEAEIGGKYGTLVPFEPDPIYIDEVKYEFKYWYYSLVENPEPKDHIIVDEETEVKLDYDHDIIAYFAPFKTLFDFTNTKDETYFRKGTGFGIPDDNPEGGNYTNVAFDDNKKAIKITPTEQKVIKLYCIMDLNLEDHWRITYTVESVCASEDENKSVKFAVSVKGGGNETYLPASQNDYNITNGGEITVSGVTKRNNDNQLLLIIDISNLTKRTECEFYINKVEIDTDSVEPLVYDMSNPYNKDLLLTNPQWGETTSGGEDFVTLCEYDETKKAYKVTASKNTVTKLHVHLDWFEPTMWLYADKQLTYEIEVDTGTATGENIKLRIQCKNTTKPEAEKSFYICDPKTEAFADGTYTVTGDVTQDINRLILIIDVSELSDPTLATFYIKKLTIDRIPPEPEA